MIPRGARLRWFATGLAAGGLIHAALGGQWCWLVAQAMAIALLSLESNAHERDLQHTEVLIP